ncbi:MAG TPA: hypothetical protein VNG53_02380 [Bacteroidia bacterium]|nr:hypothetical protein [Bacteroidia bacterium]
MACEIIFVLNDGTELLGKEKIDKNISSFPPNILDTIKPIFIEASSNTEEWKTSIIRVYQNGEYEVVLNIDNSPHRF